MVDENPTAPLYCAVSDRPPTPRAVVVSVATPPASRGATPRTVPPSRKVTVPVGIRGESMLVTVAASVTDSPNTDEGDDADNETVTVASSTVWVTGGDELDPRPGIGTSSAPRSCTPGASDEVVRVATPSATVAEPMGVVPSKKATSPWIGAGEVTVATLAVSVTVVPNTEVPTGSTVSAVVVAAGVTSWSTGAEIDSSLNGSPW